MKSDWDNVFPCSSCGSLNVTGSGYCGNCGTGLHYNCPDCGGWVNATLSSCPNCGVKLDWPWNRALAGKPSSPAVVLLMLGIIMLVTGGVYLVINNPGSVNAVSNKPASPTASIPYTYKLPAEDTTQHSVTYINSPASNSSGGGSGYSYYDPYPAAAPDTASYDVVITIPATTPSSTNTSIGTISPPDSSYLDTVFPTWGRCVNGRCRN